MIRPQLHKPYKNLAANGLTFRGDAQQFCQIFIKIRQVLMEWWSVEVCSKFRNDEPKIEQVDPNIEVTLEMENENENASTCPIFHKIH